MALDNNRLVAEKVTTGDRRLELVEPSRLTLQTPALDLYAVHFNSVPKGRRAKGFYELDDEQAFDRAAIINDLISGQFDDADAIYCNGLDISREIAEEIVWLLINSGDPIPNHLRDFIEQHYGLWSTKDAERDYPFLAAAE